MPIDAKSILVALVLLRSASGEVPDGRNVITTETIDRYRPAPEKAALVRAAFSSYGFETGPVGGISFTISGTADTFARVFGVTLEDGDGHPVAIRRNSQTLDGFPLDRLPSDVAEHVYRIVFDEPVEAFF